MINNTLGSSAMQSARDSFTDVNSLDGVKALGRDKDPEALRKISQQFESMFMQQMLKTMRSTNEIFSEGNYMHSSATQFHQQMFDHQMALEMSSGKGMGLADVLFRQLSAQYSGEFIEPQKDTSELDAAAPSVKGASAPPANDPVINGATENSVQSDKPVESITKTGNKQAAAMTAEDFIQSLLPSAQAAAEQLNVKPQVLLAQAALETGWGKHVIHAGNGDNSHNLFNIKADQRWDGGSVNVPTLEFRDGIAAKEQANFRQYNSYAESFSDYVAFIKGNPRYQQALQQASDPKAYTRELQKAGYATDPDYADKINRLLDSDIIRNAGTPNLASSSLAANGGL